MTNAEVRGGEDQILAALKKLSDSMRELGCPESQSHSEKTVERLGEESDVGENGHGYVRECEVEAVAAVGDVGWPVGAVEWSGHAHANYEELEVEPDLNCFPHLPGLTQFLGGYESQEIALNLHW